MVDARGSGGTNWSVHGIRKQFRGWLNIALAAGVPTILGTIALIAALYTNTLTLPVQAEPSVAGAGEIKVYADQDGTLKFSHDGGGYTELGSGGGAVGALLAANNLSDLTSDSDARDNLGLGSAAVEDASAFDAAGTATAAIAAHEAAVDPHPGYLTAAEGDAAYQPLDADLTTWAGVTPSANGQSLVSAANYAAMRTLLDLEAGTDFYSIAGADAAFQPLDGGLSDIAGLAVTDGNIIVGNDTNWVAESGATARASLGLTIGTHVQAYDADLSTYAGITPSANVQSLLGAADYSAMRTLLSLVVGTNVQAYDAELAALAGLTSAANKVPMFSGSGTASLLDFKDEDNMASDSATAVPSQQSVKAYVDASAGGYTPVTVDVDATDGAWAEPAGAWTMCMVECWGGGGSGGKGRAGSAAGGGGGGGYSMRIMRRAAITFPIAVTIGAGGTAQTVADSNGNAGGTTSFGALVFAYGGGAGSGTVTSGGNGGGGGGSQLEAGGNASGATRGTSPYSVVGVTYALGSGGNGGTTGADGQKGVEGQGAGGGGSADGATQANGAGGNAVWGGAGGGAGAEDSSPGAGAGGTSVYGGNGGLGAYDASAATGGSVPGGGGGGSETGTSGAGGDGRMRFTRW